MTDAAAIRFDALGYARNEGIINKSKSAIASACNSVAKRLDRVNSPSYKRAIATFTISLAVLAVGILAAPRGATAWGLDDIVTTVAGAIGDWVGSAFTALLKVLQEQTVEPLANGFLKALFQGIESSLKSSDLLLGFDNLLGSPRRLSILRR